MHQHQPKDQYSLRNDPLIRFQIELSTQGGGTEGASTRAVISKNDGQKFRYEVNFRGDYCATKANFDTQMYEDTALSHIRCQLESRVYRDTRITLEVNSGLPRTEADAVLKWD